MDRVRWLPGSGRVRKALVLAHTKLALHWKVMMLQQNTRESAVRREQFHELLRHWLDESLEERVGDSDSHAGTAWLWVRHGGDHFYLDAGSTRAGVRQYIHVVDASRGDPAWSTSSTAPDVRSRAAVGRNRQIIEGFDFYRHLPER